LDPDLVIIATPPEARLEILRQEYERYPQATFIDVASVMTDLKLEEEGLKDEFSRFIQTHPIAGREVSGPQSARSDLFEGRAWVIATRGSNEDGRLQLVEWFVSSLGATPYRISSALHDELFARISHLPQALSVALADSLESVGEGVALAGQGLRDMLRLANSDSALWQEIFSSNRDQVIRAITEFESKLEQLKKAISENDSNSLVEIFARGSAVHSQVGGKHGARPRNYTHVYIVIDDRPGQLGAIFNECSEIEVNVEDLSLEHSPRQSTGLIRLALSESDAHKLHSHLIARGWRVHL
jgi:prephenate dehydrogenase